MRSSYDFLIAGGGLAGLSLAERLTRPGSPLSGASVLVADRDRKLRNDRTWCFWTQGEPPYARIIHRSWQQLDFLSPAFSRRLDLGDYRYHMLRGIDFYTHLRQRLEESGQVTFWSGDVSALGSENGRAVATVNNQTVSAGWAFDSRVLPGQLPPTPRRYHQLWQHFRGWVIETPAPAFDPAAATLFDFHTPQLGSARFFYVLPLDEHRALVEYTLFSGTRLQSDEYEQPLREHIRGVLGLGDYQILEEEEGAIPMTDRPFPRRLSERVLAIGTLGGRVKPSSGYAFLRIQRDSDRIAAALAAGRSPFEIPPDSRLFRWLDAVMLEVMESRGGRMAEVFTRLFRDNPVERVFRFLDEKASPPEILRVMSTLPAGLFTAAAARSALRRLKRG